MLETIGRSLVLVQGLEKITEMWHRVAGGYHVVALSGAQPKPSDRVWMDSAFGVLESATANSSNFHEPTSPRAREPKTSGDMPSVTQNSLLGSA